MVVAWEFNAGVLGPALVNGVAQSALYGLLAVALVLTYRMSRSVPFVHGGIATICAYGYWYLAADSAQFLTRGLPRLPSLIAIVLLGAALGLAFGSVVTGRMAGWPRVTVTTFSLGGMLLAAGVVGSLWQGAFERVPSPFGDARLQLLGMYVSLHQLITLAILGVTVVCLTYVLSRTRLGIYIRAIADDVEAAGMVGVPVQRVALGVWTFAGGVAGLSGALITPMSTLTELVVLFVLLRSLAGAVLGGFDSLPLALLGAIMFGLVESVIGGAVFGPVSSGAREAFLMVLLFGGILIIARRRPAAINLMEG